MSQGSDHFLQEKIYTCTGILQINKVGLHSNHCSDSCLCCWQPRFISSTMEILDSPTQTLSHALSLKKHKEIISLLLHSFINASALPGRRGNTRHAAFSRAGF